MAMAFPPPNSIVLTTVEAALASFAYVMATLAPSAARRFAIAAPMPREPPVTSATLLVKLDINLLLIFGEMIDRFIGSTDRHPARGWQTPYLMLHPCNQIWRSWEYHLFPG